MEWLISHDRGRGETCLGGGFIWEGEGNFLVLISAPFALVVLSALNLSLHLLFLANSSPPFQGQL